MKDHPFPGLVEKINAFFHVGNICQISKNEIENWKMIQIFSFFIINTVGTKRQKRTCFITYVVIFIGMLKGQGHEI